MGKSEVIDMSPAALAARLEEVRALYKLMAYLGQARVIGAAEPRAGGAHSGDQSTGPHDARRK